MRQVRGLARLAQQRDLVVGQRADGGAGLGLRDHLQRPQHRRLGRVRGARAGRRRAWWFIRKPTVPSFMPYTGLPRPPWRCRVCSMKPSPPSATSTSASSGACWPWRRDSSASARLRLVGGTGEEGDAGRRGHRRLSGSWRRRITQVRRRHDGAPGGDAGAAPCATRRRCRISACRGDLRQAAHRDRQRSDSPASSGSAGR